MPASDRGATALVLGDDKPVYETESMHQTQKGAVTSGPLRAPERARGRAGASFVLGSSPAEYTTTTSSSMIKYDALKAGRTVERMPKPTQPAIAFGDDTVEYVTNRMSEEGSSVRKAAQRYIPASGLSSLSALPKASPKATVDRAKLAGVSWKLGSDVWKPESAATASFQWPTPSASGPAAPVRPVAAGSGPVKSNIHFGDEPGRFTTESAGVFSAPDTSSGGGRQPILKPGGSGSVSFGSDAVMYKSAYSSSLGAIEGADLGAATAARTALKQSACHSVAGYGFSVAF